MLRTIAFVAPIAAFAVLAADPASAQRQCSSRDEAGCEQLHCGVRDGPDCRQAKPVAFSSSYRVTVGTSAAADQKKPEGDLNNLTDLSRALTACWKPPAEDDGYSNMQMTARFALSRDGRLIGTPRVTYASAGASKQIRDRYQDAIAKSLDACAPFAFTDGFGHAIAGRPISFRIIDDRKLRRDKQQ